MCRLGLAMFMCSAIFVERFLKSWGGPVVLLCCVGGSWTELVGVGIVIRQVVLILNFCFMSLERFLLPLKKLKADGVDFVIVGGLAVVLHGHMRLTMDIDLAVSLSDDNIAKLVKSLTELGYEPRIPVTLEDFAKPALRNDWITNRNMKALNLWRPPDPFSSLDLVIALPMAFDDLLSSSDSVVLEEVAFEVASIPHLIQMKEIAGRDTDRGDIMALIEIEKLRNEEE